ncbi:DUF5018 domain-containing protein [Cohnella sp. WQ 127256]|uniref:DUF5018 domain-containing protein n=1 Tax=Cohnella sp. WQ 127256 TaxID=2938790 RepID=UPI0035590BDF
MMKWSKLFLVCVIALGMGSGVFIHQTDKAHAAVGVSYYVDSDGGNDQNSGHSPSEAWKSLANVNATIFQPGDKILFKAGGIWNGRMYPRGSGNSANPITIDMYGVGSKPLIAGNGAVREVIFLFNQQYWEINNLEITNKGTVAVDHRKGVFITAHDGGTLEHIYLRNLVVHDVNANNNRYEQGGIIFTVTGNSVPTKYNDILVEGNTVYSVDRVGIFMSSSWANRHYVDWGEREWIGHTNVVIQNNTVYDFGGDAILPLVTSGAIVQNNVAYDGNYRANTMSTGNRYAATMWTGNSDNITFQYNEAYNSNGILDGMGFDADYDSKGTTIQYNYSHDNAGGFVMIMGAHNRMDPRNNDDVTIRYNISQNDATVGNWVIQFSQGIPYNTQIYNNTFYSGPSISNWMIGGYSGDLFQDNTYYLTNNIFYNLGSGGYYAPRSVFDSNVFYGNHPASEPEDANKITTDPMFVFPGSGGIGRDTVDGYKLLEGSPAIGSGAVVANNGGEDYWGNPVSATERPNRGAYNGPGVVGSPQAPPFEVSSRNILINPGFETGDIAPWGKTGPVEVQGKVVNTNAHNGTYAMELGVGYNGFDKTVTGLTPNTNYQVTAVIKNRFKGDVTFLGVQGYGGSQNTSVTGTVYEMAMLQFRTGPTDTEANIYLWKGEGNKDVTYVDDLSLVLGWNAEQAPIAGKSSERAITDFKVPGQVGASILDETANTVTLHVPFGTDVSRMTADVLVSDKARVSPMRGAIVDLNTPQTFSVTAENGLIQPWVITAIINAKSSEKLITGFKVPGQVGVSTIDTNAHTVTIHMPFGSDVSRLTPDISVSVKAQVSPNQGAIVNFSTPQTYSVTAEDGSVQEWTITVIINAEDYVKSSGKLIKDFKVSGQVGVSTINTNAHTVTLHMPFGSDVSKLTPDVSISDKAQVSPNQGAVVNFSTPQSYIVTAEDGTIQMWSITVIVDAKDNGSGGNGSGSNGSGGNSGGVTGSGTNSNSNGGGIQDMGTQIVSESFLRNASGNDVVLEAGDGINEILLPVNAAELLNNRALEIRIGSTVVQLSPEVLNSLFKLIGSEAAQGLQISVHVAKLSEQNLSSLL